METYSVVFDTGENKSRVSSDHVDWINTHTVRSFEQIGTLKTTAQLHPELFTRKLIAEAKKTDRVKVLIGNGVTELLFEGDTVVGVVLSNGEELKGDQVVVCLGPWSGKLPLPNQPKIPVEGSHVHSIVLKPSQYIPNHALFTAILENSTTAEPEVKKLTRKT
jgi:glycine/D-amino acid oxidase-like deaminating enzyme